MLAVALAIQSYAATSITASPEMPSGAPQTDACARLSRAEAPEDADLPLGADVRRELFLIVKEAVNNVVRHAACTAAEIELHVAAGLLTLAITDNGKGFCPDQAHEGNGLASMHRRSRALGGELNIESSPRTGTRVTLRIPLRRKLRPFIVT